MQIKKNFIFFLKKDDDDDVADRMRIMIENFLRDENIMYLTVKKK